MSDLVPGGSNGAGIFTQTCPLIPGNLNRPGIRFVEGMRRFIMKGIARVALMVVISALIKAARHRADEDELEGSSE